MQTKILHVLIYLLLEVNGPKPTVHNGKKQDVTFPKVFLKKN